MNWSVVAPWYRILEIVPCLLMVPAVILLIRAIQVTRETENKGLVVPLVLFLITTLGFTVTQGTWLLSIITHDRVYRFSFPLLRAIVAILWMIGVIALGRFYTKKR